MMYAQYAQYTVEVVFGRVLFCAFMFAGLVW